MRRSALKLFLFPEKVPLFETKQGILRNSVFETPSSVYWLLIFLFIRRSEKGNAMGEKKGDGT